MLSDEEHGKMLMIYIKFSYLCKINVIACVEWKYKSTHSINF